MVENNSTTFRCNICNKNYKDKSGLWYHNKKYHMYKLHQNPTILHQKLETSNINSTNLHQNTPIIHTHKYECEYCNNIFSRSDSLNRHYNRCKYKLKYNDQQSQDEIINLLKQAIDEQKKMFEQQIIEMKNQLLETINKKCKVHPKTLQKINKQLNCNNMVKNNITYNIVGLGHENLDQVFSRKEKMAILKNRFYCLPELVEYTHFNDKYPQFKNILITNTQNTLAYKYDTKKNQFMAINKDELLDDIVDARICDITSFYEELENALDEKTKEIIEKVIDKIENDPAYRELKKKDIKLIIYNNRKKVVKDNLLDDEFEV
jgi:uncharacterized protein YjgD (DUF1641 family)